MSQTNYVPLIAILNFGINQGPYGSGVGSPEGSAIGYPGYIYVNTSTGDLFAFNGTSGTNTGWVLESGGGGGGAQLVTYTSGTPANPDDIAKPAMAYDPTGVLPTKGWNTSTHLWT